MNPAPKQPDQTTYSGRYAARLRQLREKAGLTIEEMVEAMASAGYETASRTLYHWEAGPRAAYRSDASARIGAQAKVAADATARKLIAKMDTKSIAHFGYNT